MSKLSVLRTIFCLCVFSAATAITSLAQTFTTLVSFDGNEGENPSTRSLLQGLDENLFGITSVRGAYDNGTFFKIAPVGTKTNQDAVTIASLPADAMGAKLRAAKLQKTIALADFNGDGIIDVAVADFLSDTVLVMLGDGAGGFRLAARLHSSGGPRSIVVADFNHDGLTDLAIANFFSGAVTVLLGRGDGTFEEPRSLQLEQGLASLVSADFDADGIPDLAVANFFSGQVVILKGAGDGTFEARSRLGPIGATSFLYAGDFNNSGLQDLLAFDASGKEAWLIAGERGGSFKAAVSVDPTAAVALVGTQELANGILPVGERRMPRKIAGDGQLAYPSSVLPTALVVAVTERTGRAAVQEPMFFSNLYGGASLMGPSPSSTDDHGQVSAEVAVSVLPGITFVVASASGGAAAVFGAASVLQPANFFKQVEASLSPPASLLLWQLLNKAQSQLNSNDVVGAVATLQDCLEVLAQVESQPGTKPSAPSVSIDLLKRLLNQVILFGADLGDFSGTILCGQPVSGTITVGNQMDHYTFSANAGEVIVWASVATSGSLDACADLYFSGTKIATGPCNGRSGTFTIAATGKYTLDVHDATYSNTGTYNLNLQFTTGRCASSIGCGQIKSATISAVAQQDTYSFSAKAGEAVTFASVATSGSLDACAYLFNTSGIYTGLGVCNSRSGQLSIPTTGNYVLYVVDSTVTKTGNYNLGLQFTTGRCASSIGCGQIKSATISAVAQQDTYSFSAKAGEAVTFASVATSGSLDACAYLFNTSGIYTGLGVCNSRSGQLSIPTTGNYVLYVVDSTVTKTGNYNLGLQFTTGRCASSIGCGQIKSATISAVAQQDTYSFSAKAGEAVTFASVATSGSLDACAYLFNTSGIYTGLGVCNSRSGQLSIPTTGNYVLYVVDSTVTKTGNYNLGLQFTTGRCASSIGCGQIKSATISAVAQQDTYSFRAIAGQAVTFASVATSGSLDACAYLFNTSGIYTGLGVCNSRSGQLSIPTTGNYVLYVVDNTVTKTGTYKASWKFTTGCPICSVSPASLTFPNELVGTTSASKSVTLTNTGKATMSITGISLTGANRIDFQQTHSCGTSLAVSAKCNISVSFKPTAKGTRAADISVADNANPQTVPLTGTGTVVKLVPTSLSFGNQPVGTKSSPQTMTLTNTGRVTLNISGITVTGTDSGDFAQTNTCDSSVAAGKQCSISVIFQPKAKGTRSAAVSISDDGGGSPQKVPLSGTGT